MVLEKTEYETVWSGKAGSYLAIEPDEDIARRRYTRG